MLAVDGDDAHARSLRSRHDDRTRCDERLFVRKRNVAPAGNRGEHGFNAGCTDHGREHEIAWLRVPLEEFARSARTAKKFHVRRHHHFHAWIGDRNGANTEFTRGFEEERAVLRRGKANDFKLRRQPFRGEITRAARTAVQITVQITVIPLSCEVSHDIKCACADGASRAEDEESPRHVRCVGVLK